MSKELEELLEGWHIDKNNKRIFSTSGSSMKYESITRIGEDYAELKTVGNYSIWIMKKDSSFYHFKEGIREPFFLIENDQGESRLGKIVSERTEEKRFSKKHKFISFDKCRINKNSIYGLIENHEKQALIRFDGKEVSSKLYDNIFLSSARIINSTLYSVIENDNKEGLIMFNKNRELVSGLYDRINILSLKLLKKDAYVIVSTTGKEAIMKMSEQGMEKISQSYSNIKGFKVKDNKIIILLPHGQNVTMNLDLTIVK